MYGLGILKGLSVTFKHLVETYVDDFRWGVKRYTTDQGFEARQGTETRGLFRHIDVDCGSGEERCGNECELLGEELHGLPRPSGAGFNCPKYPC